VSEMVSPGRGETNGPGHVIVVYVQGHGQTSTAGIPALGWGPKGGDLSHWIWPAQFWEAEPGLSGGQVDVTVTYLLCLAEHLVEFGVGPELPDLLRTAAGDGDLGSPLQRLLA
jgi:hypothetical protein